MRSEVTRATLHLQLSYIMAINARGRTRGEIATSSHWVALTEVCHCDGFRDRHPHWWITTFSNIEKGIGRQTLLCDAGVHRRLVKPTSTVLVLRVRSPSQD